MADIWPVAWAQRASWLYFVLNLGAADFSETIITFEFETGLPLVPLAVEGSESDELARC